MVNKPLKNGRLFPRRNDIRKIFPLDSPWKNPSAPQTVVLQILLRFLRLAQGTSCHATPELRLEVSCGGCNATSTGGLIFRYHSRCMGCNLIWLETLFHKNILTLRCRRALKIIYIKCKYHVQQTLLDCFVRMLYT